MEVPGSIGRTTIDTAEGKGISRFILSGLQVGTYIPGCATLGLKALINN